MTRAAVLDERLRRQGLTAPLASEGDYLRLFARLQPVAPIADSRPGDPPRLVHRCRFDDGAVADGLRAERQIVKGRYLGGTVGYILADDLPLYAAACARSLERLTPEQAEVLAVVQRAGPLSARQIKEETGLLSKRIAPALQRLQEACLVYEDQVDDDWGRAWYELAAEWPAVQLPGDRPAAEAEVLRRALAALVFATAEGLADWSGWPARRLAPILERLERDGLAVPATIAGLGEGWLTGDWQPAAVAAPPTGTWLLHRADMLVRSEASALRRRFAGREVLQYLLVDGAIVGAALGHWRIGPHEVEDVAVELPAAERTARREELLAAVAWAYHPPHSRILSYDGRPLEASG